MCVGFILFFKLLFFYITGNNLWLFLMLRFVQINSVTGVLRIKKELDFETKQFFNLTVLAEDRGVPSLQSQTFAEIEVCKRHIFHPSFFPTQILASKFFMSLLILVICWEYLICSMHVLQTNCINRGTQFFCLTKVNCLISSGGGC